MSRDRNFRSDFRPGVLFGLLVFLIIFTSAAYDFAFGYLRVLIPGRRANVILVAVILIILLFPWRRFHRSVAAVHSRINDSLSPYAVTKAFQESRIWFSSRLPSGGTLDRTLHFLIGIVSASLLIISGIFIILFADVIPYHSVYEELAIKIIGFGAVLAIGFVVLRFTIHSYAGRVVSELVGMGVARMQRNDPIPNVGEIWLIIIYLLCLVIISIESSPNSLGLMIDTDNASKNGYIRIEIKDIDYRNSTIATNVSIQDLSPIQKELLEQLRRITINGTEYGVEVVDDSTAILKDTVPLFLVSGSQFYYPFSQYRVFFTIEHPTDDLANLPVLVYVPSWVNRVADPLSFEQARWFTIGYTSLLQILSISVIFIFFWFPVGNIQS